MFKNLRAGIKALFAEDEKPEETGAHAEDKDAPSYHRDKRAIKDQFTNHWDMDYMTHEELEALAKEQKKD
jgi:hypothetical protein